MPVGDRYVLEEMLRSGSNLGGEQSGHIILLDDATTGDGLLTAVKIASLVALRGPLDELVRDLKVYPQTIINVNVRVQAAARGNRRGLARARMKPIGPWPTPAASCCATPGPSPRLA